MSQLERRTVVGTVLVADDDRTCRDSIQRVLEREGYQVEAAADVDSALAALRARRFDLVVCDYRMPGKSGIDLLEQVRRERLLTPVLMISACADAATEKRALELGALELLRKPLRRKELIDRAAQAVGG
jgi:two-component system response regulator HydG